MLREQSSMLFIAILPGPTGVFHLVIVHLLSASSHQLRIVYAPAGF